MVGRKRIHNKHLPRHVYPHRRQYRLWTPDGWVPLGKTEAEMYARLSGLLKSDLVTMGDVLDRYAVEIIPGKSLPYQRAQRDHVKRLRKAFGHMRPDQITTQHVYGYLDGRRKSPVAANNEVATLSHVFRKAIRWGAGTINPVVGVERYETTPRDRYVTEDEFWTVHNFMPPMIQSAMELALLTALRKGNLLALTRDHLTDDGIEFTPGKGGKPTVYEWSNELRGAVRRALQLPPQVRKPVICTRRGTAYTGDGFYAIWQRHMVKIVEKTGVERFTFHDIRAKSASDDTLEAATERLGHNSAKVTERGLPEKTAPCAATEIAGNIFVPYP